MITPELNWSFSFMSLSTESIEKFKEIYKRNFGEEISEREALEKATRLINLYRAVYGPSLISGNPQGSAYKKDGK
jgi:hypothetical protein